MESLNKCMDMRDIMRVIEGRLDDRDEAEQRARNMIADVTRYGRSIGIDARFRYPAYHAPEIEMTDLNAKHDMGTGAGTKFMTYLCQKADEADFNLYVLPSSGRNKIFYERFGFMRDDHHSGGVLVRYVEQDWDDDDREEYEAMRRKALGEPELDEDARLPLRKGVVNGMRGEYAALVVVMDPNDFIRLTTPESEVQQIYKDKFALSVRDYDQGTDTSFNKNMYNMPFLIVTHATGQVEGHEGRHRAAMVAKEGGKRFPCVILFRTPAVFELTYSKSHKWDDEEDATREEHQFTNREEVKTFTDELEKLNHDANHDYWYSNFDTEALGRTKMRGSPRSDTTKWEYDAWTPEDMPDQLIGQYDPLVIVPKSRMKVGVVKGYSHYK
jgi:hypothetical protein